MYFDHCCYITSSGLWGKLSSPKTKSHPSEGASLFFGSKFIISGYEYVYNVAKVCIDQFWFALTEFWVKFPWKRPLHPKIYHGEPKLFMANISNLACILASRYYELRTKEKLNWLQIVNFTTIINFPHRRYQQCSSISLSPQRQPEQVASLKKGSTMCTVYFNAFWLFKKKAMLKKCCIIN